MNTKTQLLRQGKPELKKKTKRLRCKSGEKSGGQDGRTRWIQRGARLWRLSRLREQHWPVFFLPALISTCMEFRT